MKKFAPLMLCISLFASLTAVAFVGDEGKAKATKTRNAKGTHSPTPDTGKRIHKPLTNTDTKTKSDEMNPVDALEVQRAMPSPLILGPSGAAPDDRLENCRIDNNRRPSG